MGEASHPSVRVVALVALDDLEVLHLQLRDVVHGDLEAHRDRAEILAHVLARILRDETAREQLRRAWVRVRVRVRVR